MEQFVEQLKNDLTLVLKDISASRDKLVRAHKSVEAIRDALFLLRNYIDKHSFADKASEIHYFKTLAPPIYALLFYYRKEYRIELEKQHASRGRLESFLIHELEVANKFYEFHQDFHTYYYERDTYMDDRIFVRDRAENTMMDEVEMIMAQDFCVGCYWTARLLANEQLKGYLLKELDFLHNPPAAEALPSTVASKLKWTDSQTDLVELIYALHAKGSFNKGNADVKEIVEVFEGLFSVDLGNFYGAWQELKRRKKGGMKFLDEVRERMARRMEE